jgi:RNA recognition motif-containing protein
VNCFSIEHFLHMRINLSNSCGAFLSVTGASRGYAFVEYETEREMRHAYKVL